MTSSTATQPLIRKRCRDRDSNHELFLLVLPLSFVLTSGRPGPVSALAGVFMILTFAALLWAQGWGAASRRGERLFGVAWASIWLIHLALLAPALAPAETTLGAILPGALAVAGAGALFVAWRARSRRSASATEGPTRERPFGPAVGVVAIMGLAGALLHGFGALPLRVADLGVLAVALGCFLALRRQGRPERSEPTS